MKKMIKSSGFKNYKLDPIKRAYSVYNEFGWVSAVYLTRSNYVFNHRTYENFHAVSHVEARRRREFRDIQNNWRNSRYK